MARRKKKRRMPSLFPFLSVLLCAMGVLIVVISAQNLVVVGGDLDQVLEIGQGEFEDRSAIYVECREEGIVIYPEQIEVEFEAIEPFMEGTEWDNLRERVTENRDEEYLVFLIRPEGIRTYQACFYQVMDINQRLYDELFLGDDEVIQMGKDALLSGGELFLTDEGKPVLPNSDSTSSEDE